MDKDALRVVRLFVVFVCMVYVEMMCYYEMFPLAFKFFSFIDMSPLESF